MGLARRLDRRIDEPMLVIHTTKNICPGSLYLQGFQGSGLKGRQIQLIGVRLFLATYRAD